MFVDTAIRHVKFKATTGEQVIIIAGTGKEGNSNGKSTDASFFTPMGVCVEMDNNIFVADAKQVPLSLIITPIKGTIGFLKRRGLLCKAFSVHLKHQPTSKRSITEMIRHVELLQDTWKKQINGYSTNLRNCASLLVNMARFPTKQSHLSA